MQNYDVRRYTSTGRKKNKDELIAAYYAQWRTLCKCGHSVIINPKTKKKICTHCGNWVYANKKDEFKEKLEYARKSRTI